MAAKVQAVQVAADPVRATRKGEFEVDATLLPAGVTVRARGRKLVMAFALDVHDPLTCDPANIVAQVASRLTRRAKVAAREALARARDATAEDTAAN